MFDELSRISSTESALASTLLSKISEVEFALDRLLEDAKLLGAIVNVDSAAPAVEGEPGL